MVDLSSARDEWSIKVIRVDNGFIVVYNPMVSGSTQYAVFADKAEDGDVANVESMIAVLWEIVDFFSVNNSRYASKRVSIEAVSGDKYNATNGDEGGG